MHSLILSLVTLLVVVSSIRHVGDLAVRRFVNWHHGFISSVVASASFSSYQETRVYGAGGRDPIAADAADHDTVEDSVPLSDTYERLAPFVLSDQFGNTCKCSFPTDQPIVLLAADRKGYESLQPWIATVRQHLINQATILGVADLRSVPSFLKGRVARKFKSAQGYPILLDWDGDVLNQLDPVQRVPNIYLISPNGDVQMHLCGQATPERVQTLLKRFNQTSLPTKGNAPNGSQNWNSE